MEEDAPWLYALPPSARRFLLGTERYPSLLTFVVGGRRPGDALRRAWRSAMRALVLHIEAVGNAGADGRDTLDRADVSVADRRSTSSPQRPQVYEPPARRALRGRPLTGPSERPATSGLRDGAHLVLSGAGRPDHRSALAAATSVGPTHGGTRTTSDEGRPLGETLGRTAGVRCCCCTRRRNTPSRLRTSIRHYDHCRLQRAEPARSNRTPPPCGCSRILGQSPFRVQALPQEGVRAEVTGIAERSPPLAYEAPVRLRAVAGGNDHAHPGGAQEACMSRYTLNGYYEMW